MFEAKLRSLILAPRACGPGRLDRPGLRCFLPVFDGAGTQPEHQCKTAPKGRSQSPHQRLLAPYIARGFV